MVDLKSYFERCYMVNLDRRIDRWERVHNEIIPAWPMTPIERWSAVDGSLVSPPTWWSIGSGAWGCYRSHVNILERCLTDGVKSVLVLEDDLELCDNFAENTQRFLEEVPDDWDMICLGGQLHIPPKKISEQVYQASNVICTHAFAISSKALLNIYQWLHPKDWCVRSKICLHVDYQLTGFHALPTSRIYVPTMWLTNQGGGYSDICKRNLGPRYLGYAVRPV